MPRRRQPRRASDQLPDASGRVAGRFPTWWADVAPLELQRSQAAAQLLVKRGYGPALYALDPSENYGLG
jgi:hypothetical protein